MIESGLSEGTAVGFSCAPCQWDLTMLIGIVIGLWLAMIIIQLKRIADEKNVADDTVEEEEPDG
jgi:hypothetical protein